MIHRVPKFYRSKMSLICSEKDRQCVLRGYCQCLNGLIVVPAFEHMICGSSTVHHVPKYMSYYEAIEGLVITGRAQ